MKEIKENERYQTVLSSRKEAKPVKLELGIDHLLTQRFLYCQDTHHSTIVTGTTRCQENEFNSRKKNTSIVDFVYDHDGVRIGLAMATVSMITDQSSSISETIGRDLVKGMKTQPASITIDSLPQIFNSFVKKQNLTETKSTASSLMTTLVTREAKGFKAISSNISDGMVLVIDHKTQQIKQILPARQFKEAKQWQPASLDGVSTNKLETMTITDLAEDDLIIHLSSGIWSGFAHSWLTRDVDGADTRSLSLGEGQQQLAAAIQGSFQPKESKSKSKGGVVELERAARLSISSLSSSSISSTADQKQVGLPPAFSVADAILHQAMQQILQKRAAFLEFCSSLDDEFKKQYYSNQEEKEQFKVSTWLSSLPKNLLPKIIEFFKNDPSLREITVVQFLEYLKRQVHFGDQATISVMRVPNHRVELIRALLEYPENASQLIPRIIAEFNSDEEIQAIVQRLQSENIVYRGTKALARCYPNPPKNRSLSVDPIECKYIIPVISRVRQLDSQLVNDLKHKSQNQQHLKARLKECQSVKEMAILFDVYKEKEQFNRHANPFLDWLFGKRNTRSWQTTVKEIRDEAKQRLFSEVKIENDSTKKQDLLAWAKEQNLFKEHRSNSIFTAWGRTQAIKDIENEEEKLGLSNGS